MDYGLRGSSVHGILQARILEWVAISFSRGSSQPRNRTLVSCVAGRFFTDWAMREAQSCYKSLQIHSNDCEASLLFGGKNITSPWDQRQKKTTLLLSIPCMTLLCLFFFFLPVGLQSRCFYLFFFSFIFIISWRLITLQYCSGFCHTLTWLSHGFMCLKESLAHINSI